MASDPLPGSAEDLAFIRKVMEDSRRLVEDNGFYYVLWGGLCILGAGLSYLAGSLGFPALIPFIWCLAFGGAGLASALVSRKERKRAKSLAATLIGRVWWSSCLLGAVITAGLAISGALSLPIAMAICSAVIAAGFLLSGAVSGSRGLALVSIPWWLGGLLIGRLPFIWAPLALTCLTFFFEFLPGLVMYIRWKKGRNGREA
jgi:hypothetical protein